VAVHLGVNSARCAFGVASVLHMVRRSDFFHLAVLRRADFVVLRLIGRLCLDSGKQRCQCNSTEEHCE
jgi:hypothetical protein